MNCPKAPYYKSISEKKTMTSNIFKINIAVIQFVKCRSFKQLIIYVKCVRCLNYPLAITSKIVYPGLKTKDFCKVLPIL